MSRVAVLVVLILLYLLHFDFWFWHDSQVVLGLPVGLLYHVLYCLLVAGMLALILRSMRVSGRDRHSSDAVEP